jgi:hypothetical protein
MGLTLFESRAGLDQLKITPVNADSSDGTQVFCLGSDLALPPPEDYNIGDKIYIEQSFPLTSGTKLVKLQGRFRQPRSVLTRDEITGGTITEYARTGVENTTVIKATSPTFTSAHNLREVYIMGSGVNNGHYKIAMGGMDYNPSEDTYEADSAAAVLFGNGPLGGAGGPEALDYAWFRPAHWRAAVYFQNAEIFDFDPGQDGLKQRDILLPDITINVSRCSGVRTIKIEFELIEYLT